MITVTRNDVKRKARVSGTAYDSEIDALIDETVPVIEYAIDPVVLNDSTPGLVATLDLAALEIVSGEFLASLLYEEGAIVPFQLGWLRTQPLGGRDLNFNDPFGLKSQGWRRLRPYLRAAQKLTARSNERVFVLEDDQS
ncbi:MAG: hypothetical protein HUU60_10495 [Armatimonadetes bacterium]|nr:hypothetical protein [Armatimonadota bacterium]